MSAHSIRRYQIKRSFFELGFKNFASFCNVCVSLQPNLSKVDLASFWTNSQNSESVIFSFLEDIIETLKYE